MFQSIMWQSSARYKQEYNYNHKSVRTIPPFKIIRLPIFSLLEWFWHFRNCNCTQYTKL